MSTYCLRSYSVSNMLPFQYLMSTYCLRSYSVSNMLPFKDLMSTYCLRSYSVSNMLTFQFLQPDLNISTAVNHLGAGTDFRRQNLTSKDVRL